MTDGTASPASGRNAGNPRQEIEKSSNDSPGGVRTGFARNAGELRASGLDLSPLETEGPFESRLAWFELLQHTVFPAGSGVRYVYAADGGRIVSLLPVRIARRKRSEKGSVSY
jgi:hypothetical protein